MFLGAVFACHLWLGCTAFYTGTYADPNECWAEARALAVALKIDGNNDVRMTQCGRVE